MNKELRLNSQKIVTRVRGRRKERAGSWLTAGVTLKLVASDVTESNSLGRTVFLGLYFLYWTSSLCKKYVQGRQTRLFSG